MAKNKRLSPMDIAIISTMVAKLSDEHMVTLSVDAGGAFITASPNFPPEGYDTTVNIEEAPKPIEFDRYGEVVAFGDMTFGKPDLTGADDELEIPSFLKRGDDKIKTKKASYLETSEYMENGVIKPLDVNILRDRMLSGSKIYLVLRTNTIDTEAVVVKYIIETQNGDTIISTTENLKFKLKQE